ncbi:MAG: DUF5666 domain-containing protein [Terracidiphilus sp.]
MASRMQFKFLPVALTLMAAASLIVVGCSSVATPSNNTPSGSGPAFVVGTDAPLAGIVSFSAQVETLTVTDTNNNVVPLITGTPTVDFARYNGLQTLMDVNTLPPATYNEVSITLGTATIGYLNVPGGGEPTIASQTATYPNSASTYTYTVSLPNPITITALGGPVGVRVDLDLRQSISVDGNGNFTGAVTPTFDIRGVTRTGAGGYIDEFVSAVVTAPGGTTEPQSFTVQGPHGENFTIDTTAQTEWDGNASLSTLAAGNIVQISGTLDPASQTFDADEVAILSQGGFAAGGLVTYVNPSTGPANSFDIYVRGVLPGTTGVQLGTLATVELTGSENYTVFRMHNSFSNFTQTFFNRSGLVAGQDVVVGGSAANASSESDVTVNDITLRPWGYNGTIVPGSENAGAGTFKMQVKGFAGQVIPQAITVYLGSNTDYRFGLAAFGDVLDGAQVRVVGLLIVNPSNGNTVLLARHIDGIVLTDF